MKVTIRLFARLREIAGSQDIIIELPTKTATVGDIIKALVSQYHEMKDEILYQNAFELKPVYKLMVDGEDVSNVTGLSKIVSDGAILRFFPPVYGG